MLRGRCVVPVHAVAGWRPKPQRRGADCARCGRARAPAAAATIASAGGTRVSGVQCAPRTPAPQCRAEACHARPAPLPRRLTAWPTRPPPPHAATLWRRYASQWYHHANRHRHPSPTFVIRCTTSFSDSVPIVYVRSRSVNEVSSEFDRPQTGRNRREWLSHVSLDGAGSRSCGERFPPAPRRRRRRLLFRAVREHKIIIGRPVVSTVTRHRPDADVNGAWIRAGAAYRASPTLTTTVCGPLRITLTRQILTLTLEHCAKCYKTYYYSIL